MTRGLVAIKEDWTPADAARQRAWHARMYAMLPERDAEPPEGAVTQTIEESEAAIAEAKEELARIREFEKAQRDYCGEMDILAFLRIYQRPSGLPTIKAIVATVAKYYGCSVNDINSSRRHMPLVRRRQVAMYLCRHLTSRSFPEIGRKIGDKDHTTVINAIERIGSLRLIDPVLNQDVIELEALLA